jgi:uncharacterized protein (TIGR02266 family)
MRSRQQTTPVATIASAPELCSSDTSGTHAIAHHLPEQLQRALRERDDVRAERDDLARRLKDAVDELALLKSSLSNAPSLVPSSTAPALPLCPPSDSGRWPLSEPSLSRMVVSTRPSTDASSEASWNDDPDFAERPSVVERRRLARLGGEFEVEFLDDTHLIAGLTQDISEGGVFVATYQTLALGTKVTLALELPLGRVEVRGEVRWARPELEGSDQRPGFGVAFTELTPEALAALRQFCLSHPAHYYEM